MDICLTQKFKPSHDQNLMKDEGNVEKARNYYFNSRSNNLKFLLKNRYQWMNTYIDNHHTGIEIGSGSGLSKEFITCPNFKLSDFADYDWIDLKNTDAIDTKLPDQSLDFVIASNMIHHVPHPVVLFDEINRVLKPGGKFIIQDIYTSYFMRMALFLMKHEGYDNNIDVFDPNVICTDPKDLWSANCAIPRLLFDDLKKFEKHVPSFKVLTLKHDEFFCFLNSGGVISKTFFVPLPHIILKVLGLVDKTLATLFPRLFALQTQIVLEKTNRS